MTIRIIKNDMCSIFSFKRALILLSMFIILYIANASEFYMYKNIGLFDFILLALGGPFKNAFRIIDEIKWLLPQIFLSYVLTYLIDLELKERNIYLLPRISSLKIWWFSKIGSLSVITFIYFTIEFFVVIILAFLNYPVNNNFSKVIVETFVNEKNVTIVYNAKIIFNMFFLLWLTSFLLSIFQLLISMIFKNAMVGLICIIMLNVISIHAGFAKGSLFKWFPSNHGIFMRHNIFNISGRNDLISISWSYSYVIVLIILLIIFGFNYIKKREILY